jgi:Zn-dependent M28 family amino/carboxypeptidase
MIRMPGKSYSGPFPPLTGAEVALRAELERDLEMLAVMIGERNVWTAGSLERSADFIVESFESTGLTARRLPYEMQKRTCENLEVEIPGGRRPDEIVVVGGHYDTVPDCAGANDNGTGVVATLALARLFAARAPDKKPDRTLRFVAFVNEEPPYFQTGHMGSVVYAKAARAHGENITAAVSLETIGCYTDEAGSQRYPPPMGLVYPSVGNFIGFVGSFGSRKLVRQAIATFRERVQFPSEGGALPGFIPGVGWSDHWAFAEEGYPAIMVTDTAPFRYPHYHRKTDTVDKIDFDRMTRVVMGLVPVIEDLVTAR